MQVLDEQLLEQEQQQAQEKAERKVPATRCKNSTSMASPSGSTTFAVI